MFPGDLIKMQVLIQQVWVVVCFSNKLLDDVDSGGNHTRVEKADTLAKWDYLEFIESL